MSIEQEILALEREYWQLPDIQAITKRLVALEQQLAASGTTAGFAAPPGPPCTNDFPQCCIPLDLTVHDSYHGDTVMTYQPANLHWFGCKTVATVARGVCAATSSTAIAYILAGSNTSSWTMNIWWRNGVGGACPIQGTTCAQVLTNSFSTTRTPFTCSGVQTWSFVSTTALVYPAATTINLTINMPSGT